MRTPRRLRTLALLLALALASCGRHPMEKAGRAVDDAVDKAGDNLKKLEK